MMAKGMDENTIMEITGLTQEGNQKVDIIDMIKKFRECKLNCVKLQ